MSDKKDLDITSGKIILRVDLLQCDELYSRGEKIAPYVIMKLANKTVKSNVAEGSSPQWEKQNFKFKSFIPKKSQLLVSVKDSLNKDNPDLGVAYMTLDGIPKEKRFNKWLTLSQVPTGKIQLSFYAEGFGDDPTLFNKSEEIQNQLLKYIYSDDDRMTNCVIILEDKQAFLGVEQAFQYINQLEDSEIKTVVIFGGNYLVQKTIEIKKNGTVIYCIDDVEISEGKGNFKKNSMFEIQKSVKRVYLHNLKFKSQNINCFKIPVGMLIFSQIGCSLIANSCVLGQIVDLNDGADLDNITFGGLKETQQEEFN